MGFASNIEVIEYQSRGNKVRITEVADSKSPTPYWGRVREPHTLPEHSSEVMEQLTPPEDT